MEDYVFKIVVEIDEDKVNEIGETDLNSVYGYVRTIFVNHRLHDTSKNDKQLVFISKKGEDYAFSAIGLAATCIYDGWVGKYLKDMEWYDSEDGSVEDMLAGFRRVDARNGR